MDEKQNQSNFELRNMKIKSEIITNLKNLYNKYRVLTSFWYLNFFLRLYLLINMFYVRI